MAGMQLRGSCALPAASAATGTCRRGRSSRAGRHRNEGMLRCCSLRPSIATPKRMNHI